MRAGLASIECKIIISMSLKFYTLMILYMKNRMKNSIYDKPEQGTTQTKT